MQFERKIAEEALAQPTPPAVEPTGDQRGGEVEIRGGAVVPKGSPHKDWRHVIAHNCELRSHLATLRYTDLGVAGPDFEVDFDFAYHLVRGVDAGTGTGTISFAARKPSGVPSDQGAEVNGETRTRRRVRVCDVQIFYPQATTLNFSGDFVFGTYGHLPRLWELEDLTTLLGPENAVVQGLTLAGGGMPDFVRDLEERSLQQVLAPHQAPGFDPENPVGPLQRAAGTTDYLRFCYNEQTGRCLVTALSIGVVGDADPALTPPEAPTLPDDDPTDTDTSPPWSPTRQPRLPRLPSATGDDYDYTDENGNPLTAEPPPAGTGTVYALHDDGFSVSKDGGRSWRLRLFQNVDSLIDMVAGPSGVYFLTSEGAVLFAEDDRGAVNELDLGDAYAATETELPLINGNFELGDLNGWTLVSGDEPRVLDTSVPPQRDGSTHYLTRDWRILFPQDFAIEQTVEIPADAVGQEGVLRLSADALTERGDIARVELFSAEEIVAANDNFTVAFTGGVFRANGFATSPTAGPLNLIGEVFNANANWGPPNGFAGISLFGNRNQAISGEVAWRVETQDGTEYDGLVALRLFDLDNANGTREILTIQGVVSYDTLVSQIVAQPDGPERVIFLGANQMNLNGDLPQTRFHVVVRSRFGFAFEGEWEAGLGMKGPGVAFVAPRQPLGAPAETSASDWTRISTTFEGELPSRVTVRVSGVAVGGHADVYIDNVSLTMPGDAPDVVVGAMAPVRERNAGGGADFYIGDTVIQRRASQSPEDNLLPHPGPGDGIALFGVPGEAVVAAGQGVHKAIANGARVSMQGEPGRWTDLTLPSGQSAIDVQVEPVWSVLTPVGSLFRYDFVLDALEQAPVIVSPDASLASDFRRQGAVVTGSQGGMSFVQRTGSAVAWAAQPTGTWNQQGPPPPPGARRTCCLDSGRYLGHPRGAYSLFWTDAPQEPNSWRYAGRLERPIMKIVAVR